MPSFVYASRTEHAQTSPCVSHGSRQLTISEENSCSLLICNNIALCMEILLRSQFLVSFSYQIKLVNNEMIAMPVIGFLVLVSYIN